VVDEEIESRMEREALREARYLRYARYERTLRSSEGSLLVVYEVRARERDAARGRAGRDDEGKE
jgi:hypothetical protein